MGSSHLDLTGEQGTCVLKDPTLFLQLKKYVLPAQYL